MSVHPTTIRIKRAALATSIALLAAAAPASASEVVVGNPSCADVDAKYKQVKIDPVPQGVTTLGSVTITVRNRTFDWTSTTDIDVVVVKGGPNATVYRYGDAGARSGTGLQAPINPKNGQPYGLSHISFCADGSTPPPPPGPCEPGGPTTKADGTPCVVEPPKECEKASDMKNDGTPCTPDDPKPPVKPEDPKTPEKPVSTTVPSQNTVLGQRGTVRVRAAAAMQAPRRCVARPFTQVVTGRAIRRVTLSVNGKVAGLMRGTATRRTLRIDPRSFRGDVLRITARVQFRAGATLRTRTLRVTALRCAPAPTVRFAG